MALLDELIHLLGPEHVLTGADAAPWLTDWRGRYVGSATAVVRPANTEAVAEVVKACARHGAPVVPLGGNTGLVGGGTPDNTGTAVVVSLQRMTQIRSLDTDNDTVTVEAGCILQTLQQAARDAKRLFPLSLAAEGSCTIGGNLASNAGGTQVLRYGNMRELTLGLEVVTPEGEIWHGLRGLRKDNTGYDLRDLYIGSEGTLGIITAATLRLYPQPAASCTALVALDSVSEGVTLLSQARLGFGPALTGFELMSGESLALVTRIYPQQTLPLPASPWFALLELSDSEGQEHARERFETVLGAALESGLAKDAVIAESIAQSKALWHLRESIPLAQAEEGKNIKHDVSIPISRIPEFVETTDALLAARFPGIRQVIFGHLGDGNLHYNVAPPLGVDPEVFLQEQDDVYQLVHDSVHAHSGSISAEHGVGQLKRDELPRYKSQVELNLMRKIKDALDPSGMMNPGKVL
ncbi:FAD-binding oxidoreductase [Pigmentiphaga aceris]|uniref:FAD-binding oxidoreductase n=1 Tax=Pigmentiphaga aceris TaxID=1940612 RepID=A0A5C0AX00_9BURK|nr:FAD-binding oxidoreductase [Pigmentiphaga aceris]QEI06992.1 FAD-binding oxidoreductase [Pigmentiphaga aceris]